MAAISLDEQKMLDANIGRLVLQQMRMSDSFAELKIEVNGEYIDLVLTSDVRPLIMPHDDLEGAVSALVAAHERVDSGLRGATYEFRKAPDGRWNMMGRFAYARGD